MTWAEKPLGEVCTLQRGFDLPGHQRRPGRVPIVSSSGPSDFHSEARVRAPGVVTGRYGTIGQVFHVTEDFWPLNTTLYVRDFQGNDPRFVFYLLTTIDFESCNDKSGVPGVNRNDLHSILVERPPLDQQRAIVEVLGALDDKIELNRQTNHTLEEMASGLFERIVGNFDDDPSVEHPVSALIARGLLEVNDGYRAKREELAPTGLPFARAGNIDEGFNFRDAEYLGEPGVKRAGRKVSRPFDIVFTSKGTVGRFAFVTSTTPTFAYSPQLCFWRSLEPMALSPYFLYHWMRSERFIDQVDAVKGQTDMADYVSLTDQRAMRISCPPPQAQQSITDAVAGLWDLHAQHVDESRTLAALRDTLLPKLLSGEIRLTRAAKAVEAAL